jgi:transposase
MTTEQAVLNYRRLAEVERAFRTLQGVDLQVSPIRHRLEDRVKAYIFPACWPTAYKGTLSNSGRR